MSKFKRFVFSLAIFCEFLIVVFGVLVGCGYWILSKPSSGVQNVNVSSIEEMKKAQTNKIRKANYSTKVSEVSEPNYARAMLDSSGVLSDWGIGAVVVPSENISLPVFAGTSDNALLNGVGTYSPKQQMGKGNYVVMSHNIVRSGALLSRLNRVSDGSLIYLTDFEKIYTYKSFYNQKVYQDRVDLVSPTANLYHGKPTVTLFRCQGNFGTPWRRLVKGYLVDVHDYNGSYAPLQKHLKVTYKADNSKVPYNINSNNDSFGVKLSVGSFQFLFQNLKLCVSLVVLVFIFSLIIIIRV